MANDNNIKTFTAADIEKYQKGQLSPKEMHALEKAALDDPFLADALDGYGVATVNVTEDIADLTRRLAEKAEQGRVIPLIRSKKQIPWIRIAALLILIAGAGLLSYQLLFSNHAEKNELTAKSPAVQKAKPDSSQPVQQDLASESPKANSVTVSSEDSVNGMLDKTAAGIKTTPGETYKSIEVLADSTTGNVASNNAASSGYATVKSEAEKKDDRRSLHEDSVMINKSEIASNNNARAKQAQLQKPVVANSNRDTELKEKSADFYANDVSISRRNDNAYRNTNVFHGKVIDANNNPLPFANISNTRDNVGTYSDAQGNFTLISPDSVLNVQVKSLGFENNYTLLKNIAADNRVIMQEDQSLHAKVLDTVKRNLSRARKNIVTLEEPEPEDGWDSWDTYVVNNTNVPDAFQKKSNETTEASVEVSFEVNKNGEPVNLKVEKSLCDKCDEEAKRLVKEGPRWKRKAKKSKRTTVTIPFIKP